jgi:hypothetical protein
VAQRVVDIEEAGLWNVRSCDDVPARARISNVLPVFNHIERRATLTYNRSTVEYDMARQTIEEVIDW